MGYGEKIRKILLQGPRYSGVQSTAYGGFAMLPDTIAADDGTTAMTGEVPEAEAIPVKKLPDLTSGAGPKFTKIEIINVRLYGART